MVFALSAGLLIGALVASYNKGYDSMQFIPLMGLTGVVAAMEYIPDIHYGIGVSILTVFACFATMITITIINDNELRDQIKQNIIVHQGFEPEEELEEEQEELEEYEGESEEQEDSEEEEEQEEQNLPESESEQEESNTPFVSSSNSPELYVSEHEHEDEMTGIQTIEVQQESQQESQQLIESISDNQTYVEKIEKEKYSDVSEILESNRETIMKEVHLDDRKDYFHFPSTTTELVTTSDSTNEITNESESSPASSIASISVKPVISSPVISSDCSGNVPEISNTTPFNIQSTVEDFKKLLYRDCCCSEERSNKIQIMPNTISLTDEDVRKYMDEMSTILNGPCRPMTSSELSEFSDNSNKMDEID